MYIYIYIYISTYIRVRDLGYLVCLGPGSGLSRPRAVWAPVPRVRVPASRRCSKRESLISRAMIAY